MTEDVQTSTHERTAAIRRNWWLFVLLGGVLVVVGLLVAAVPAVYAPLGGGFLRPLVGWLLVVAGLSSLALVVRGSGSWLITGFVLADGILYLLVATVVLVRPLVAVVRFEGALVGFFVVHGCTLVVFGSQTRPVPFWYAVVIGGVVSVVLGGIVSFDVVPARPTGAFLFGVSLVLVGLSLVLFALGSRPRVTGGVIEPWG